MADATSDLKDCLRELSAAACSKIDDAFEQAFAQLDAVCRDLDPGDAGLCAELLFWGEESIPKTIATSLQQGDEHE